MRRGEVLVGMERAKLAGKHIGRPRVIDQEGFLQRFRERWSTASARRGSLEASRPGK